MPRSPGKPQPAVASRPARNPTRSERRSLRSVLVLSGMRWLTRISSAPPCSTQPPDAALSARVAACSAGALETNAASRCGPATSGTRSPTRCASSLTASTKPDRRTPSESRSPCHARRSRSNDRTACSRLTVKDGVFSLWNGQQAMRLAPARFSGRCDSMTSTMSTRLRSS